MIDYEMKWTGKRVTSFGSFGIVCTIMVKIITSTTYKIDRYTNLHNLRTQSKIPNILDCFKSNKKGA